MDEYRKRCGDCRNFDDGICDFNGWQVWPEENPRCGGRGWEMSESLRLSRAGRKTKEGEQERAGKE